MAIITPTVVVLLQEDKDIFIYVFEAVIVFIVKHVQQLKWVILGNVLFSSNKNRIFKNEWNKFYILGSWLFERQNILGSLSEKNTGFFGSFSHTGGGGFSSFPKLL